MNIDILSPQQDEITLLQITDTHLFADDTSTLLGVNTNDSFNAVVDAILQSDIKYQALVMTGDVSQDHTYESYQRFANQVKPLISTDTPSFWLPGNHDEQINMKKLSEAHIHDQSHVLLGKHWQMVLLDSQVEGEPHGYLTRKQFRRLESALEEYPERHTLVFLHHHAMLMGSEWLDQHCLHNRLDFLTLIEQYPNIKGVVCGHVHQDSHQNHQHISIISTPATCMQFKPNSKNFGLDDTSPGWRTLTLSADGNLTTKVYRLPQGSFLPELDSNGY